MIKNHMLTQPSIGMEKRRENFYVHISYVWMRYVCGWECFVFAKCYTYVHDWYFAYNIADNESITLRTKKNCRVVVCFLLCLEIGINWKIDQMECICVLDWGLNFECQFVSSNTLNSDEFLYFSSVIFNNVRLLSFTHTYSFVHCSVSFARSYIPNPRVNW